MKKLKILFLCLFAISSTLTPFTSNAKYTIQKDLLDEYQSKLTLIEKQFATFKQQIDPKTMSEMDFKMKVGNFENNRNTLKAKLNDLKKTPDSFSETDKADINNRFKELETEFKELKKLSK